MTNVLSGHGCQAIIAAGESVNFLPDAPLRESGETNILAHNPHWVVDSAFHDALWSRASPFVPVSMGGRLARGLDRRFRVYQYVPGAEYRAHIDGAWPPSGILPNDTYVYDAPVLPVMGGAAIFPHGDARDAPLHEGTGVRKSAKYVIRMEIEYDVKPVEAA
jgi:hypothetical protein